MTTEVSAVTAWSCGGEVWGWVAVSWDNCWLGGVEMSLRADSVEDLGATSFDGIMPRCEGVFAVSLGGAKLGNGF